MAKRLATIFNGLIPDGTHTRDIEPFQQPRLPQFYFEWHRLTQKVYVIHLPGEFVDGVFVRVKESEQPMAKGECIAEHVPHHAAAYNFVQTFCRGYLQAVAHHEQKTKRFGWNVPDRIIHTSPLPVR